MVVPLCAMGLLGKRLNHVARISGSITVPDVARDRFHSPALGVLAMALIVFFMTVNLVAQFKAGSVILQSLLGDVTMFRQLSQVRLIEGVDSFYLVCLLVFGIAVILYTTWGGFHAVVWTDVMQGIVMVGGVLVLLPLAISQVGGLETATRQMAQMTPPRLGTLRVSVDAPAEQDMAIQAGTWLAMTRDDYLQGFERWLPQAKDELGKRKTRGELNQAEFDEAVRVLDERAELVRQGPPLRVFRVVQQRLIDRGQSTVRALDGTSGQRVEDGVQVVELTTPREIEQEFEKQRLALLASATARQKNVDAQWERLARESAAATNAESANKTSQRQAALQQEREQLAAQIAGLGDPEQLRHDLQPFNAPFVVGDPKLHDYAYAANRPGYYVTGPGPDERSFNGFLPLSLAVSFFFMWAISGAGQPSSMVRLMAFKNSITLRRSIFTVSIYFTLIYFPLVVIFCCARVLLPGLEGNADAIMPQTAVYLTQQVGHGWLAGVLLAAPFAAVMSTVDSFLLMISSALVRDVYQRNVNPEASEKTIKRLSYLCTLLVGTGAMIGAISPPKFLQDIIVYCGSGLAACFLAPIFFAIYWKRTTRQGAFCGMLAGFLVHLSMYLGGKIVYGSFSRPLEIVGFDPVVPGLVASFVTVWVVSKLTPKPPEELVRRYFYKEAATS